MNGNLVSAPAKAFSHLFKDGFSLLDYRAPSTFSALWLDGLKSGKVTIDGQEVDLTNTNEPILLIGNDPPSTVFDSAPPSLKGINFRNHFTASSWLAAWRVRFPDSPTRIAVIDPRELDLATGTAKALQSLLGATGNDDRSLVPGVTVLNTPALETICRWLSEPEPRIASKNSPQVLDLLRSTIWNELVSNREKHHAVSNVMGAFLLNLEVGRGLPHAGDPWTQDYLKALLSACGIDFDEAEEEHEPDITEEIPGRWISASQQRKLGGVVLLDDMADLWAYFLRGAAGFCGEAPFGKTGRTYKESLEVFALSDFPGEIGTLPSRLTTFLDSGRERLSAGDILGRETQLDEDFTLFLDLRLFPKVSGDGKPGDIERNFLQSLGKLGLTLLDSDRTLPWLESEEQLSAFRTELEAVSAGNFPAAMETLLPRLLALIDPTLPIVIFSSTHRTELIDPFRSYGNLILDFRKPILGDSGMEWKERVLELRGNFSAAVNRAARIHRIRRGFCELNRRASASQRRTFSNDHRAVEIFIDESYYKKTNVYAIGAVALSAESHSKIRKFCRNLEEQDLIWGLSVNNRDRYVSEEHRLTSSDKRLECERRWFVNFPDLPERFLGKMANHADVSKAWESVKQVAIRCGVEIHLASLGCEASAEVAQELRMPQLQGVGRDQADELHRELSKVLLQCLFVAHPEVSSALRHNEASLAVDVGTRTAAPKNYYDRFEDTYQSFGIGYTDQALNNPTLEERCDLWNKRLRWAKRQHWWRHGNVSARIVGQSIEPSERDLSSWLDSFIWSPHRKMISVTSYDGLNYLRETLASLHPEVSPNIVRARGCALFDFEDTSDWLTKLYTFPCFPYQPHYLADWVSRSGVECIGEPHHENPLSEGFSTTGFVSGWSGRRQKLLDAVLRLDNEDETGGLKDILDWLEAASGDSKSVDYTLESLLLSCGQRSANKANGSMLRSLFSSAA